MSAVEALATFRIRAQSAQAAAVSTCGISGTLAALSALAPSDIVDVYHFKVSDRVFTILIDADHSLVGCLRVMTDP